jgi:hypothetical protein
LILHEEGYSDGAAREGPSDASKEQTNNKDTLRPLKKLRSTPLAGTVEFAKRAAIQLAGYAQIERHL